jgi:hypothetical protein
MQLPDAETAEVSQKAQKLNMKLFLEKFFCGFCEVFAAFASGN